MTSSIPPNTFHDKGPSLGDVLRSSSTWEGALVPLGPTFRWTLIGAPTALAAVVAVHAFFGAALVAADKPRLLLFGWPWFAEILNMATIVIPLQVLLIVALVLLAMLTEGFSLAGRRLQTGLAVLLGLTALSLLPVVGLIVLTAANVVTWISLGVLIAAVAIGLLVVFLDSF